MRGIKPLSALNIRVKRHNKFPNLFQSEPPYRVRHTMQMQITKRGLTVDTDNAESRPFVRFLHGTQINRRVIGAEFHGRARKTRQVRADG